MTVVQWARSVKPALVGLQMQYGIPAAWASAQMAHESAVDGGRRLSDLATQHHNYAGLKWAPWQRSFGCRPVRMGTWEEIDGVATEVEDAFCSCPSWDTWLMVYADLLMSARYRTALAFAQDPLLYGVHVWQAGWATDSRYVTGVANWMTRLRNDYWDTLPRPEWRQVAVKDGAGDLICTGWLAVNQTLVPLRPLWEQATKGSLAWDQEAYSATLYRPDKEDHHGR